MDGDEVGAEVEEVGDEAAAQVVRREPGDTGVAAETVEAPVEGQRTSDERDSDRPMLCDPVTGKVAWPNCVDLDPLVLHGDFEPATSRAERQVG